MCKDERERVREIEREIARSDSPRETGHIFTFSSSDRHTRAGKYGLMDRRNVSRARASPSDHFMFRILVRSLASWSFTAGASSFPLLLVVVVGKVKIYFPFVHSLSFPLSYFPSPVLSPFFARRDAISEKLIIHLRRRYVFPVDARCAFNAFAGGSMRGVLVLTLTPPSPSLPSPSSSFLARYLFPVLIGNWIPNPG